MTGSVEYHVPVTGVDPVNAQHLATKNYVDGLVNGAEWKQQCRLATAAALATNTYANGSSGVGATLTGFAFGALSIDGVTPTIGDRVLVKNEVTQSHNGIYTVTVVGGVATLYVLTRATDYDQPAETVAGTATFATEGTANADTAWVQTTTGAITVGSTSLVFAQFGGGAGVSYATPAIVLGSAAAAGAASTVIRSDGTIAAFDTTAPTTQAFGDAAAVGTAAFAARRDHKHAMPATPTSVSGNAGTATALQTARTINGVSFDGTANITNIAEATHAATSKTTPVDADELALVDTAASNVLKKLTGTNLKAYLKAYFDTLYSGSSTSRKTYLNKPAGNITRAATSIGAFSTAWQITGVVVASGQNIRLHISASVGDSSVGNDRLFALFRDSTQIAAWNLSNPSSPSIPQGPMIDVEWIDENPGAATYTYEVRCAAFTAGTVTVYQTNPTTDVTGGSSVFIAEVYTP